MTLLELEAAIYAATLDPKVHAIISGYVQQEREKNAEKQRRSRATRAAAKAIESQSPARHGDGSRARGDYHSQDLENKKTLPADWGPNEDHRARAAEDGRGPGYVPWVVRMFRAHVREKAELSSDWDARFSRYLEANIMMFPNAFRPKEPKLESNMAAVAPERIHSLPDDVRECLHLLAAGETRLPRRYPPEARTEARKLHARGVALTAKPRTPLR